MEDDYWGKPPVFPLPVETGQKQERTPAEVGL